MSYTVAQGWETLNLALGVVGAGAVTFIGISWKLCQEDERLDRGRAILAVILSASALVLALVAVLLMVPTAWQSIGENRGDLSGFLVAYNVIFVLTTALAASGLVGLVRAIRHLARVLRVYRS